MSKLYRIQFAVFGLLLILAAGVFEYFSEKKNQKPEHILTIACGMEGLEESTCWQGVRAWEEQTGHRVKIIPEPNGSTERLSLLRRRLLMDRHVDIYQIDVIWPGVLADCLEDLNQYFTKEDLKDFFPQLIENNTVKGRLVAIPFFVDVGFLYYRKDLLQRYSQHVPRTWADLEKVADYIMKAERAKGHKNIWGFVFQGRAHELLACNALEWIYSHKNGGMVIKPNGEVSINNPSARSAIEMARGWIGAIAPKSVLRYDQEDCQRLFQSGGAVFMRHWPDAWTLVNAPNSAVAGNVGVAPLPKGGKNGRHTGALGGWGLAITKKSKNKKLAAELIRFLTSFKELRRRSRVGGYIPPIKALFKDPAVLKANPLFQTTELILREAALRPSRQTGAHYPRVSLIFQQAIHTALQGERSAEEALIQIEKQLNLLSHHGTDWS